MYLLTSIAILSVLIKWLIPNEWIYQNRIEYTIFKNNPSISYDLGIKQIKHEIEKNKLKNYILFLGDSVGYGTPCPSHQTISFYLEELLKDKNVKVFNLSQPSLVAGDIWVLLQKLEIAGINTDNIIINSSYLNYVLPETEDPLEGIFWLKDDYVYMGYESWYKPDKTLYEKWKKMFLSTLTPIKYREVVQYHLKKLFLNEQEPIPTSWVHKKDYLKTTLSSDEYKKYFSDKAINLNATHPIAYFLNKIISERSTHEKTLFITSALNKTLIHNLSSKKGFIENEKKIDNFFKDKDVEYINLNNYEMNNELFSDHTHLLPEGYQIMAQVIYEENVSKWGFD